MQCPSNAVSKATFDALPSNDPERDAIEEHARSCHTCRAYYFGTGDGHSTRGEVDWNLGLSVPSTPR
jgi:hypothetical protein